MVKVFVQLVGGPRKEIEVQATKSTVAQLCIQIGQEFSCPSSSLKLVSSGSVLGDDAAHGKRLVSDLNEGDVVLAMPMRRAPVASVVSASLSTRDGTRSRSILRGNEEEDEDNSEEEEEERARMLTQLPTNAPRWERGLVSWLRSLGRCPSWLVDGMVLVRPLRVAWLGVFILGCLVSSRVGLGPIFILAWMVWVIFSNLGRRREGDPSAYSIFNEGVKRLPGQLDADKVDEQIRRGQM